MNESRRKALVAIAPEAVEEIRWALGSRFEVLPVHRLADALRRLRSERVEVILCGIYFDESRMFDLLRAARTEFPDIPFLTCRIFDQTFPIISLEAILIAAESLGAAGFINLPAIGREVGDARKYERFRELVEAHLIPRTAPGTGAGSR